MRRRRLRRANQLTIGVVTPEDKEAIVFSPVPRWFKVFGELWRAALWRGMVQSSRGYMRHSLRNTGRGKDRRADKLTDTRSKFWRSYKKRYG